LDAQVFAALVGSPTTLCPQAAPVPKASSIARPQAGPLKPRFTTQPLLEDPECRDTAAAAPSFGSIIDRCMADFKPECHIAGHS
jgi:hypothetical protein